MFCEEEAERTPRRGVPTNDSGHAGAWPSIGRRYTGRRLGWQGIALARARSARVAPTASQRRVSSDSAWLSASRNCVAPLPAAWLSIKCFFENRTQIKTAHLFWYE